MIATFKKLKDGKWGIRIIGKDPEVQPGSVVYVKRKSGETEAVTVERVIWSGEGKDGSPTTFCSIRNDGSRRAVPEPRRQNPQFEDWGSESEDEVPF